MKQKLFAVVCLSLIASWTQTLQAQGSLPEYRKAAGVSGKVTSIGSDTLNNLMTEWSELFRKYYPSVKTEIQGLGSSTAPPALIQGTSNFGPMSRAMKRKEIEAFEAAYGYPPTAVPVAIDLLAVFANIDNPIEGLSIDQVDGIFSSTYRCGGDRVTRWRDVGLQDRAWRKKRVRTYGRNSVSGTYSYFKKVALCKGDFSKSVSEQSGSSAVVQAVANDLYGIGYSGIGYQTSRVRVVPLAPANSSDFVTPTAATAINGDYPLSRLLYIYVNKAPGQPLKPLEKEFVRMILSRQGQEIVAKTGYIPLPFVIIDEHRKQLNVLD
ncbi:MAG: PstS family phosphate ABC transporter substrate-binding protein [Gammaproteobacteria bacterium]